MAWSAGSRAWGRAAERLISTGPTNPVCQHGCPGRLVRLHGCERVAGHRSRFWFGRGSGASDEDSHTTACAGAKRASGEREPRCLQVVLSNRAEDARKLFSLALAKRKSHQAGPARADRVRPRAAIPIGGLPRPGVPGAWALVLKELPQLGVLRAHTTDRTEQRRCQPVACNRLGTRKGRRRPTLADDARTVFAFGRLPEVIAVGRGWGD